MSERAGGRERGAGSAEYIGTIVVAALLVGAIVFAISPQGANVRAAVCDAVSDILRTDVSCGTGGEGEDGAGQATDEDFKPPVCQVSRTGEEYNSTISVGFVDIGDNAGLVRTVMSDGTITLTATDGAMFGASGSVGADVEAGGGTDLGAEIEFGGGVTLGAGDTWTFSGEDAAKQAEDFENLLVDHQVRQMSREQAAMQGGSGLGPAIRDLIDPLDPLPEPDSTTVDMGVIGGFDSQLGLTVSATEGGTGPSLDAQAIAGSIDADATWTRTRDTHGTESMEDDTKTYTVDMSINPDVSSDIWAADLGLGDTAGMSMAVTQNAEGQIIEIAIVSTNEGAINGGVGLGGESGSGSKGSFFTSHEETTATVTTTKLTLDPEAPGYAQDAAVVEEWLGGDGYEWPGTIPMSAVNPAHPGSDPFSQLMHEQATVSAITSEGVTSTTGLAAEVALGLKLGFDFSANTSEAEAVYAAYLGAPRGGERSMVPYEDCIS